jgi:hypothetical protein
MKSLFSRVLVVIIVIGSGWLIYNASDYSKCSGPKSEAWLIATKSRLDDTISDEASSEALIQELFVPTPTPGPSDSTFLPLIGSAITSAKQNELKTLANNSHMRYLDQQSQETPSCLSELQGEVVKAFYYDWQYYLAAMEGDKELVNRYADEFNSARDEVIIELDKLSVKYD